MKPEFNTFGASVNKIAMCLFSCQKTIPENICTSLELIREKVKSKELSVEDGIDCLYEFGDSVERMLTINCLMDMEEKDD